MGFPSREPLSQMAIEEDDGFSIGYQQDESRLAFIALHEQRGQKVLQQTKHHQSQQAAGASRPSSTQQVLAPCLPTVEKQVLPVPSAQDIHKLLDVMLETAADSDAEDELTHVQQAGPSGHDTNKGVAKGATDQTSHVTQVTQAPAPAMQSQWELSPPSQPLFHTLEPLQGGQQASQQPPQVVSSQTLVKAPWLQYTGSTQAVDGKGSNRRKQKGTSKLASPSKQTAGSKRKPPTASATAAHSPTAKGITSSALKRLHGAVGSSAHVPAAQHAAATVPETSTQAKETKDPLALLLAEAPRCTAATSSGHTARKVQRQKAPPATSMMTTTPVRAAVHNTEAAAAPSTGRATCSHMTLGELLQRPAADTAYRNGSAAAACQATAEPQQANGPMSAGRSSGRSFGLGAIMDDLLHEDGEANHHPPETGLVATAQVASFQLQVDGPQQPSHRQGRNIQQGPGDCTLHADTPARGFQTPLPRAMPAQHALDGSISLDLGPALHLRQPFTTPTTPAWPSRTPLTSDAIQKQQQDQQHAATTDRLLPPSAALCQLQGSSHQLPATPCLLPSAITPGINKGCAAQTPQGFTTVSAPTEITPAVSSKERLRQQSAVKDAFLTSALNTPAASQQAPGAATMAAGKDADWWGPAGLLAVQARTGNSSARPRDRSGGDGLEAMLKRVTAGINARQHALMDNQQRGSTPPTVVAGALLCTVQQRAKEASALKLAVTCDQLPEGQGWLVLVDKTSSTQWDSLIPGSRLLVHPPYKEMLLQERQTSTRVVLAFCCTPL